MNWLVVFTFLAVASHAWTALCLSVDNYGFGLWSLMWGTLWTALALGAWLA